MTPELKTYYHIQAVIAAAFNFFISGMIIGLIYHQADAVPVDTVSLAVDILITALCTSVITALFMRAAVAQTQTRCILPPRYRVLALLSRLFDRPALLGTVLGIGIAAVLMGLILPLSAAYGFKTLSFWGYLPLKTLSGSLLGAGITVSELYIGMCRTE